VVKIRLQRRGRKKLPVYKIVVAESRSPRDGRFIEALGEYAPTQEPAHIAMKKERVLYWLQQGAQPTATVVNLLSQSGIMLHLHLLRKGKTQEEIAVELEKWKESSDARKAKKLAKRLEELKRKKASSHTPKKVAAPAVEAPAETAPEAQEAPAEASE
jgi:small subunit ribosomal protein S16